MKTITFLLSIILLAGCQSAEVKSLKEDNALLQKKCDLLEIKVDYLLERDSANKSDIIRLASEDNEILRMLINQAKRDNEIINLFDLHLKYNH